MLSWHQKDSEYYELCPYHLKTDGHELVPNPGSIIFENYWQGLKLYPTVYDREVYCHHSRRGNPKYLWFKYPTEKHFDEQTDSILPEYYNWRSTLWNTKYPIRYPNGFNGRHSCKFAVVNNERLGYIETRKRIYFDEYIRLIRVIPSYHKLLQLIRAGSNLIIYEVDVPASTKKGKFGEVDFDGTYECTLAKLDILMKSPDAAFGHGLCLAYALLTDC